MKNLLIKIVLWGVIILFPTLCSAAWTAIDCVEYRGYTGEAITIEWDASDEATSYELEGFMEERQVVVLTATTPQTQIAVVIPASGHYTFRVRACNEVGCSDWAESTNPTFATVDGQPRCWSTYGYLAPPGPVIIE